MSPQDAIDAVKALTDELAETYKTQADYVVASIESIDSKVGEFKRWDCKGWLCWGGGDGEPSGWDEFLHFPNVVVEDHPDQQKAREGLEAAQAEYNTNSDEHDSMQEELAEFPTNMGAFLIDWFTADTDFANIFYPASPEDFKGPQGGWLSDNLQRYNAATSAQLNAAATTRDVLGSLISGSVDFLAEVTSTCASFVTLALDEQKTYEDAVTVLLNDYSSIGGFISAIEKMKTLMQDSRDLFFDKVAEEGERLASAVGTTISVGLLENDLLAVGQGGNWATPSGTQGDPDNPSSVTSGDLEVDGDWFRHQVSCWDELATEMGALKASADATSNLPITLLEMPHFTAMQSRSLNGLADKIAEVIGQGAAAATQMGDALELSFRNYLENEMASKAEADAFFAKYFG